jgi:hypothetical protein
MQYTIVRLGINVDDIKRDRNAKDHLEGVALANHVSRLLFSFLSQKHLIRKTIE